MGRGPGGAVQRLKIVFEDKDVLVVDKPAGLISANMPGETRESLFDIVKEYVRGDKRKPVRVWIIHRLDKEASGLLVFAKTEKAFQWLKEDFRAKRVHRLYLAVVEGEIGAGDAETVSLLGPRVKQLPGGTIQSFIKDDESGTMRSVAIGDAVREGDRGRGPMSRAGAPAGRPVGRGPLGPRGRGGPLEDDAPRLAVTHWRVLGAGQDRSLLQLRLETGRKNQIRVHMQEFKHPIIGDARYGATTDPIGRMALHASELGFTHPGTGQMMRYFSPAPAEFYRSVGMEPPAAPVAPAPPPTPAPAEARPSPTAPVPPKPAAETSWDHVAEWYDGLIEEERSDHFRHVIVPGTLRLLRPPAPEAGSPPMRVLDVACGQGALSRKIAELGAEVVGVDASPRLIEAARQRAAAAGIASRFEVGDARDLGALPAEVLERPFDAATCVMALMNIDPLEPVLRGAAGVLKSGGSLVAVILHPAFRAPGQTGWGWDRPPQRPSRGKPPRREDAGRQFRRVDGYLSPGQTPITMNPGRAAHGEEPVLTWTFHRPIQTYVRAFTEAGFLIEALEEWPSMRKSQPGPRAAEENRARREIPMFLGIRAVKVARASGP